VRNINIKFYVYQCVRRIFEYLQSLGSDVRVFESVGRMFLLTDIKDVRKNLSAKITKSQEKIKVLQVYAINIFVILAIMSSLLCL